jgi:probable F420-dependent oxidoreductase
MEIGVYVPNCHHGVGLDVYTAGNPFPKGLAVHPETFERMAVESERLGFDALWVGDHVVFPPHTESPHANSGHLDGADIRADEPIFDPLVVLTYLAAITERVKLATSILVIPYRNPVLASKWLASLDVLSKGRVILGAGVGWLKEEFDAVAAPFEQRGPVTEEYIRLMRILWTEDEPSFDGQHYRLEPGLRFYPKPVQQPIPVWGGGNTGRGMRRAARLCDGWIPSYLSFEEYGQKCDQMRGHLEREDRDPERFAFGHHARLFFYDEPYPDAPPCIGSPTKIADDVKRFQDMGVDHLEVAPPPGPSTDFVLEQLYRFADEVMPKVG